MKCLKSNSCQIVHNPFLPPLYAYRCKEFLVLQRFGTKALAMTRLDISGAGHANQHDRKNFILVSKIRLLAGVFGPDVPNRMKNPFVIIASLLTASFLSAGESALTTTYQPLAGLGLGNVVVVQVTCHHWYANSASSAVNLIHVRNVPPTDQPELATADLNLASRCGLKFSTNDLGAVGSDPMILFDATKFDASKARGFPKEDIVRASLECLRRCLPEQLKNTKVTLKSREADQEWISKIVAEFDSAPRDQPFFGSR